MLLKSDSFSCSWLCDHGGVLGSERKSEEEVVFFFNFVILRMKESHY